jgi:uncharacterized membrane protein
VPPVPAPAGRAPLASLRASLVSIRPDGPLGWCRLIFVGFALGVAGLYVALLVLVGAAPLALRIAALVAAVAMAGLWLSAFRSGRLPLLALPAEALGLTLVGVAAADTQRAFGLLYASISVHAVFWSGRRVVLAIAVHAVAWIAALLIAPPPTGNPLVMGAAQVLGLALLGTVVNLLASSLRRYEVTAAREISDLRERLRRGETMERSHIEWLVVIGRPVAEVFPYLSDPRNGPEWQSGLREVRCTPDGPVGVGTAVAEVRQIFGQRLSSGYTIMTYEPGQRICVASNGGPASFTASVRFEPHGQGTLVRIDAEAGLSAVMRVGAVVMERTIRRQLEADLASLNDLLHARAIATS